MLRVTGPPDRNLSEHVVNLTKIVECQFDGGCADAFPETAPVQRRLLTAVGFASSKASVPGRSLGRLPDSLGAVPDSPNFVNAHGSAACFATGYAGAGA